MSVTQIEVLPRAFFRWRTEHDLRYADTDSVGHINNGAFGSLIESSRTLLLHDRIFTEKSEGVCVLARFEIDYLNELNWPGRVIVGTTIERIGNSSIVLRHALFLGEVTVAIARSVVVLISAVSRRPLAVSSEQRQRAVPWTLQTE